jgi:hypothetical protein
MDWEFTPRIGNSPSLIVADGIFLAMGSAQVCGCHQSIGAPLNLIVQTLDFIARPLRHQHKHLVVFGQHLCPQMLQHAFHQFELPDGLGKKASSFVIARFQHSFAPPLLQKFSSISWKRLNRFRYSKRSIGASLCIGACAAGPPISSLGRPSARVPPRSGWARLQQSRVDEDKHRERSRVSVCQ